MWDVAAAAWQISLSSPSFSSFSSSLPCSLVCCHTPSHQSLPLLVMRNGNSRWHSTTNQLWRHCHNHCPPPPPPTLHRGSLLRKSNNVVIALDGDHLSSTTLNDNIANILPETMLIPTMQRPMMPLPSVGDHYYSFVHLLTPTSCLNPIKVRTLLGTMQNNQNGR